MDGSMGFPKPLLHNPLLSVSNGIYSDCFKEITNASSVKIS